MTDKPLNCVGSDKAQHDFNKHPALGLEKVVTQEKQNDAIDFCEDLENGINELCDLENKVGHIENGHRFLTSMDADRVTLLGKLKTIRTELERAQRMRETLSEIRTHIVKNLEPDIDLLHDLANKALSNEKVYRIHYSYDKTPTIKLQERDNDCQEFPTEFNEIFDKFFHKTALGGANDTQVKPQYGEWLPIETAPKDGTEILAYLFEDYSPQPVSWIQAYQGWRSSVLDSFVMPTHWMPLPDAPKKGQNDE